MKFALILGAASLLAGACAQLPDPEPESKREPASVSAQWVSEPLGIDNEKPTTLQAKVENTGSEPADLHEIVAVIRTPKRGKVYLNISEKLDLDSLAPGTTEIVSLNRTFLLSTNEYDLELVIRGSGPASFEAVTTRARVRARDPLIRPWHLKFQLALTVIMAFFAVIGTLAYEFVPGFAPWVDSYLSRSSLFAKPTKTRSDTKKKPVEPIDPEEWVPGRLKQRKR